MSGGVEVWIDALYGCEWEKGTPRGERGRHGEGHGIKQNYTDAFWLDFHQITQKQGSLDSIGNSKSRASKGEPSIKGGSCPQG